MVRNLSNIFVTKITQSLTTNLFDSRLFNRHKNSTLYIDSFLTLIAVKTFTHLE